jgi:hypothetical protein
MSMRSSLAAVLVTVAAAACYEAPPPKEAKPGVTAESLQGKLRHRAMLTALNSNFSDLQMRVIQYPEDYDEMWQKGFTNVGGLTKPFVNFDAEMVIFVAAGTKPRGGYMIRVDSVVTGADLAIYVTEQEPGPGCTSDRGYLNKPMAPAQIVTVPWMDKPVRFVDRTLPGTGC